MRASKNQGLKNQGLLRGGLIYWDPYQWPLFMEGTPLLASCQNAKLFTPEALCEIGSFLSESGCRQLVLDIFQQSAYSVHELALVEIGTSISSFGP